MGQAKWRGTYEQRKVEGEARQKAFREAAEERERQEHLARAKKWAEMSPESRRRELVANQYIAMGVAMASAIPPGILKL